MPKRPPLTPEQRRQRASIAALTRWANEDPAANAARGQAGFLARFERQVREQHPDLPDAEVARRADKARRAYMRRMAFHRERARQARKNAS